MKEQASTLEGAMARGKGWLYDLKVLDGFSERNTKLAFATVTDCFSFASLGNSSCGLFNKLREALPQVAYSGYASLHSPALCSGLTWETGDAATDEAYAEPAT